MFGPEKVWRELVAPHLNTYMGHEFERIVSQAYSRSATIRSLPLLKEWSRLEGTVKDGGSAEIDIVAPLASGSNILTGSIKWGEAPRPVKDFFEHRRSLERVAESGQAWAHAALDPHSPMLFVAAGGFDPGFERVASESGHHVILWTLEDLYQEQTST